MQNAATMVQRTFRGHKVRRMMNDFAQARRYAPRAPWSSTSSSSRSGCSTTRPSLPR